MSSIYDFELVFFDHEIILRDHQTHEIIVSEPRQHISGRVHLLERHFNDIVQYILPIAENYDIDLYESMPCEAIYWYVEKMYHINVEGPIQGHRVFPF
jgi:hypothetical protein